MSNFLQGTTNAQYHADTTHLSSSALKLLLKSPEQFYNDYVLGHRQSAESAAFTEGTLTHSLILEPHTVSNAYAVYNGMRKQGRAYEDFAAANAHKTVISAAQMLRCEQLLRAYQNAPLAVEMVSGGFSELSSLGEILGVPVKCRYDYINISKRYIVDVKTTGMPTDVDIFKQTISEYGYDLSAALYAQIAHDNNANELFDFYWLVLSKADKGCAIYKASSETLSAGSAQVMKALALYKKCKESGVWRHDSGKQTFKTQHEILEV